MKSSITIDAKDDCYHSNQQAQQGCMAIQQAAKEASMTISTRGRNIIPRPPFAKALQIIQHQTPVRRDLHIIQHIIHSFEEARRGLHIIQLHPINMSNSVANSLLHIIRLSGSANNSAVSNKM